MAFCKFCGTQLAEGQVCSCPQAQAAARAAAQPVQPGQPMNTQQLTPEQQAAIQQAAAQRAAAQQAAAAKAAAVQNTVTAAAKGIVPYLKEYWTTPVQALQRVAQQNNMMLAVTMTIIRALALGLLVFGLLSNVCGMAMAAMFSYGGASAGNGIAPSILWSLIYGILIGVIGMALFIIVAFAMVKIQHGTASILNVYEVSAANGVYTTALLVLAMVFSFFSLQFSMIFLALSLISWIISGVLTVQTVSPGTNTGLFWVLYLVGVVLIIVVGFNIIPRLFIGAVGEIKVTTDGFTMPLKTAMASAIAELEEALTEFNFEDIFDDFF